MQFTLYSGTRVRLTNEEKKGMMDGLSRPCFYNKPFRLIKKIGINFYQYFKMGGGTKNESEGDEIENASYSVENETLSVPRCEERKNFFKI